MTKKILRNAFDGAEREAMILNNQGLVVSVAKRYVGNGIEFEDMIQDGTEGLILAVDKFDPGRGFRFSTYASYWIKRGILRGISNKGRSVRLPVYLHGKISRLFRIRTELQGTLNRDPTRAEWAEAAGMTERALNDLMTVYLNPVSLDAPVKIEDSRRLADVVAAGEEENPLHQVVSDDLRTRVRAALGSLSRREREALTLRYGLEDGTPLTLDKVGKAMGITRQRAQQLERLALNQLRENRQLAEEVHDP